MSKLFPMFKRKGRGKEEEVGVEDDAKKKQGKASSKHSKEDHHHHHLLHLGSSPRVGTTGATSRSTDRKRKEKAVKRKAPLPNGKENRPLETGSDKRDFYIDDTGTVREGVPQVRLAEGRDAASDPQQDGGSGVTNVENSVDTCGGHDAAAEVLGDDQVKEVTGDSDASFEKDSCGGDGVRNEALAVTNEEAMSQEVEEVRSGGCNSHIEDPSRSVSKGYDANEGRQGEQEGTPLDVGTTAHVTEESEGQGSSMGLPEAGDGQGSSMGLPEAGDGQGSSMGLPEAGDGQGSSMGLPVAGDGQESSMGLPETGDGQGSSMGLPEAGDGQESTTTGQSTVTEGVDEDEGVDAIGGKVSEEGASDVSVGSDDVSMRGGEQEEADSVVNGMTDTQFVSIIDSQSMYNSQDSDDDFDSAQEDWDEEDDNIGGTPLDGAAQEPVKYTTHDGIHNEVNEAANDVLINRRSKGEIEVPELLREPSSSSSLYQDASFNFEDSEVVGIASLVDASNDGCVRESGDKKTRGLPGRLARKTSNISTASSDLFDEELDELLDEELDRLSEEDVESVNHKASSVDGVDAKTDESTVTVENVDTVDNAVQGVLAIKALEVNKQKNKDILPTADVGIQVSDHNGVTKEVCENAQDIRSDQSVEGSLTNPSLQKEPESSTVVPEDLRIVTIKEESSMTSTPALLPTEEALDQARDSGYYSLPVSPKPLVAVVEVSGGQVGQVRDDSFGDSEEEGMLTPPTEVPPPPTLSEGRTTKGNISVEETVLDSSLADESAVLYQSCCESQETEESKLKGTAVTAAEEGSKGVSTELLQNVGKHKTPKLNILKDARTELREGGISPRGGGGPTPTNRHSRHKSPMLDFENKQHGDEPLRSPDPVGDRFLRHAVCLSHEEAEARLAQRRAARAEARELRLRELEKQQQDQENDEEKQFASPSFAGAEKEDDDDGEEEEEEEEVVEKEGTEPSPRSAAAGRTPVRTAGINSTGQYSRRSSEDSTTDESLPANVREMRSELKELDEKFRKAMITNAQLDNEKATLTYEVELIKDRYTELEEVHTQLTKEHRKKCTEYEQLRKVSTKLQEEVKILRGLLQERDQLIQEYGLVVVGEDEENTEEVESEKEDDDMDDLTPRKIAVKKALLSQEAAELLEKGAAKGSLDIRLKKFGEEKNDLEDQVRRLKLELEEERNKNRRRENGLDYEKQKEQNKTVNEYKFRVQKAEAEVSTLQANVVRLDALSARYKTQSEELEKSEEELKLEKRKLQRELRDAQSRLEELETTNNHLIKRFDKLKNARSTLLKDLSLDPV